MAKFDVVLGIKMKNVVAPDGKNAGTIARLRFKERVMKDPDFLNKLSIIQVTRSREEGMTREEFFHEEKEQDDAERNPDDLQSADDWNLDIQQGNL